MSMKDQSGRHVISSHGLPTRIPRPGPQPQACKASCPRWGGGSGVRQRRPGFAHGVLGLRRAGGPRGRRTGGHTEELDGVQSLRSRCRNKLFPGRWKLCNEESRPFLIYSPGEGGAGQLGTLRVHQGGGGSCTESERGVLGVPCPPAALPLWGCHYHLACKAFPGLVTPPGPC